MNATHRPWYARPLPWQSKRVRAASAAQVFLQQAPLWTAILVILFSVVPALIVVVIGLLHGSVPPDGLLSAGSGYPAFQPPFWLLWIPGVVALIFALVSLPVSGRFPSYFWGGRLEMTVVALLGFFTTLEATIAFGAQQFSILFPLAGVWLLAIALIALRGMLGALRLVPAAWR